MPKCVNGLAAARRVANMLLIIDTQNTKLLFVWDAHMGLTRNRNWVRQFRSKSTPIRQVYVETAKHQWGAYSGVCACLRPLPSCTIAKNASTRVHHFHTATVASASVSVITLSGWWRLQPHIWNHLGHSWNNHLGPIVGFFARFCAAVVIMYAPAIPAFSIPGLLVLEKLRLIHLRSFRPGTFRCDAWSTRQTNTGG